MGERQGWTALLVSLAVVVNLVRLSSPAQAADAPAALTILGRLPSLEDIALSPDGSQLAWLRNEGEHHVAIVNPADGSRPSLSIDLREQKLRSIQWADDHTLLLTVSATEFPPLGWWGDRREWYFLETYDLTTRELHPVNLNVMDYETFNIMTEAPMIRIVDGATLLFIRGSYVAHFSESIGNRVRFRKRRLPALFRYDVALHRTRLIALGQDSYARWVVDDAGQISADFIYEEAGHRWTLRARKDGKIATVAGGQALLDLPRIVGASADGNALYVRFIEEGAVVWKPLSIKDGTWGAPLANGEAFDGVIKERLTGRILGGAYGVDADGYVFFDPKSQTHWNTVVQAFAGEHVRLVSHSDDFSKLIVQVFGSTHGYVDELIEWNPVHAAPLGSIYKGLDTVAPVQSIRYPAADGLEIPAVLTLPGDRLAKNLPLVVMPHDGPAFVDAARFDWWAQAFAAVPKYLPSKAR